MNNNNSKIVSSCKKCGKEMNRWPSQMKRGKGIFCSRTCAAVFHFSKAIIAINDGRKKAVSEGRVIGGKPSDNFMGECIVCGSMFKVFKSAFISGSKKACSKACSKVRKNTLPKRPFKKNEKTSGSNHYNWKGGQRNPIQIIRESAEYSRWRSLVFARDNYACVSCGIRSKPGTKVYLEADHIQPLALFPGLAFDLSNGRTMCKDCHRKTNTYGMNKRYVIPNQNLSFFVAEYDNSVNATLISKP